MRNIILSSTLFVFTCAGCTTAPYVSGRPIEVKGGFFSRSYEQDGKPVNMMDIMSDLKTRDETHSQASSAEVWFYTGAITGGVGGYLLGYSLFSTSQNAQSQQGGILVGVALIGLAVLAAYESDSNLNDGIGIYNGRLPISKTSRLFKKIHPLLGVTDSQQKTPFFALNLNFD